MRRIYVAILLVISVLEFLPLFLAPSPPDLQGDGLGHLFKIHKLMESGWEPWIEDWYAGFPFLRFYPPASYIAAAFLGRLLGSDVRGYAATLAITSFIGAFSMYLYLETTRKERYIAPILFLLFPWRLGVAYIEGNFPRANSINLMPLFFLAIFWMSEHRERYILASAVAISVVSLTHHSILVPLTITSLILLRKKVNNINALGNFFKVGGAVVTLTAFWYLPFMFERNWTHFWNIYQNKWLFAGYSISPSLFKEPVGCSILIATGIVLAVGVLRRRVDPVKILLVSVYTYLAMGYYSPTPWIHSLPILSMIPPYRWMDMVCMIVPLMAAESLSDLNLNRKAFTGLSLILILLTPAIISFNGIHEYPENIKELGDFLGGFPGNEWRFVVYPPTGTSYYSYLPALCSKLTMNGRYHEGNPAGDGEWRLWYLSETGKNVTPYLRAYSIRFFISCTNFAPAGYHRTTEIGNCVVYSSNVSFARPVRIVLAGKFYEMPRDYAYVKNAVNVKMFPPTAIGVIYAGQPTEQEKEVLWRFVRDGGTLVWIPEGSGELFGINATMEIINGSRLNSEEYNISLFSPFTYQGMPWYGPLFDNVSTIIGSGNRTLLGWISVGKGRVYLVGGNLLFHALYWNSSYELDLILNLAKKDRNITYSVLDRADGEYTLYVSADTPAVLEISEAYYPHWHIKIDNDEILPVRNDRTGLTLVPITHSGVLRGRFVDPFAPLRRYSALGWVLLLVYLGFKTLSDRKKRVEIVREANLTSQTSQSKKLGEPKAP
ncbi:6-pyruvoyl-tetrahydropterin synthase-related protein [Thermococcus sp. 21S7]|uniref:6-pyruvoyl-tetrahydropterin synthase-related protein n=1 Tax=Thermococcus sp. 21S7 TaxID=1638221 RepID=UPI001439CA24|nr:6-pyruvoyl-tetrahydropterin synthase-related protein [Thermococcus sp. 21S7]NJE61764.1 hypothetical protein [Thermococcus sp. 21S7]